jgi:hypothetical protein
METLAIYEKNGGFPRRSNVFALSSHACGPMWATSAQRTLYRTKAPEMGESIKSRPGRAAPDDISDVNKNNGITKR